MRFDVMNLDAFREAIKAAEREFWRIPMRPQAGTYGSGSGQFRVTHNGPHYTIEVGGQAVTFNEAGLPLKEQPSAKADSETADDTKDLRDDRPRAKIPKPPKWT